MKKISAFILSILIIVMLVSCAPTVEAKIELDHYLELPWQSSRSFSSETIRYNVVDYALYGEEKIAISTDDSYLQFTLTQNKLNTGTEQNPVEITVLTLITDYVISYESGETNSVHSEATFKRDGLFAVSTKKELVSTNGSYYFEADYLKGEARYAENKESFLNGETKVLTFNTGNYIDNEYIYYYIRAMKNLTNALESSSTFNQSFSVVNWYECFNNYNSFKNNVLEASDMVVTSVKSPTSKDYWENIKVDDSDFVLGFDEEYRLLENNEVKCHYTAIMRTENGQAMGQPFYAYYTQGAYKDAQGNASKKIIAKMVTYYSNKDDIKKEPPEYNNVIEFVLSDFESN